MNNLNRPFERINPPKPYLPEGFTTEIINKRAILVNGPDGAMLMLYDLRNLAQMLFEGKVLDKAEKAVIGASIKHLIGLVSK